MIDGNISMANSFTEETEQQNIQGYEQKLTTMNEQDKINELMKPRWRVTASYPNSPYKIGATLDGPRMEVLGPIYDQYPHLFKRLEWWQDREASEMPGYVKWVAQCHEKGMVEPVIEWHKRAQHWAANVQSQVNSIRAEYFEPATAADYQAYITKPVNQH